MFILPEDAQRIADELKGITGRDVNFIDKDGMIIASTNAARIGQIHEGARRLIRDALPSVTIYDRDNVAGAQQGINLPVRVGGETVGVIGMFRSVHSDEFHSAVEQVCATAAMISAALGYQSNPTG